MVGCSRYYDGELNVTLRFVLRPNYICKTQAPCNLPIKLILANNLDDRFNI